MAHAKQAETLWPRMIAEKALWHGAMPTQLVSSPFSYQPWEWPEPLQVRSEARVEEFSTVCAEWNHGQTQAVRQLIPAVGAVARLVEVVRRHGDLN